MFRLGILAVITLFGFALWRVAVPPLPDNVTRRSADIDGRDVTFLVIAFPADTWTWSLASDEADPKTPEEWRAMLDADVIVNGIYFNADNTPSGYYHATAPSAVPWPTEEEQRKESSYSFFTSIVDGAPEFAYLPDAPRDEPVAPSFLSFPTLINNGSPLVDEDSFRYAERTVLARAADGTPYVILTERGQVSLYELAAWLDAQPEQFTIAGNLDGGPSTGIFYEHGFFDVNVRATALPNVIALHKKP